MTDQPPENDDRDRTEPTEPVGSPPPPPPPPPRRLTRSRTDRILGGVGGGLAEHLGLDPLLVRFGIGLLVVVTGGAGLLLYVAAWLLVPDAPLVPGAAPPPPQRSRTQTILGVGALVVLVAIILPGGFFVGWFAAPFALLALAGLAVWWLVLGIPAERTGRGVFLGILLGLTVLVVAGLLFFAGAAGVAGGGGLVVAGIVVAAGLTLVASAFLRPLRWLIIPALALGLGAGTAVAAGVEDVGGSTGEELYRPAAAGDIRPHYELGAGHLVVDLRSARLLGGEHRVDIDLGAGLAEVLVPEGTCVATDLHAGIGALELFDHGTGGVDVDRVVGGQAPAGAPRVVVTGDVGLGLIDIDHEPDRGEWNDDWGPHDRGEIDVSSDDDSGNGCIGDPGAQG